VISGPLDAQNTWKNPVEKQKKLEEQKRIRDAIYRRNKSMVDLKEIDSDFYVRNLKAHKRVQGHHVNNCQH